MALATAAVLGSVPPASAAPALPRSLTELEVSLYGLSAGVDPLSPIVPKRTAAGVRVLVQAGGRTLSSKEVARLLGGPFEVQAELSGPGLGGVLSLPRRGAEAIPSPDPLVLTFPGLPQAGQYDLSNVRLVRGGRAVLDVLPRRVAVRVIEQVLVTSVTTRPLTLDEIRERGIVLDASAYLGFEFAILLKLESTPVSFRFPVVFDRKGVPIPIPLEPPPEPLRSVVAAPQLVPVLLRPAAADGDPDGAPPEYDFADLPGGGPKIPSLLVIPGSVGYLKQFFSAQLMVGNGAPTGSSLVVRNVTGALKLPPGPDGQPGTADDPLALPRLESGPQSPIVQVVREDGSGELEPGEFGRAELVLRGEHEGRHDVDFEIRADLDGLAIGTVPLEGSARGVVLVRNAYFDVTFTVPTVVRADEEFSIFATVTNIGQGTGRDVRMTVDGSRVSGARLLSAGTQTIEEVRPGDAATLEYRFRSLVTGEVVASYLRFDTNGGTDVTGRLNFTMGVGERRVAMSPDTLILPTTIRSVPSGVVRAAMRVLGQAWSAAHATTLPPGVERPSPEVVFRKGLAVAEAGLRIDLGQPRADALRDLLLDLHADADPGFDQVLRDTTAGRELDRALGTALADAAGGFGLDYEEEVARVAASGPAFLSAAIEGEGGPGLAAEAALVDGAARRTDTAARGVPAALLVPLGDAADAPRLGFVSSLVAPPYTVLVEGRTAGFVRVSVSVPDGDGGVRRAVATGIEVGPGSRHRIVFDPGRGGDLALEADLDGDGTYESREPLGGTAVVSDGPRLAAATTIGPETLDGASPFGTYAALLFDRVVSAEEAADTSRYEIADNSVLAARRQLSGRLVFVAFEQPEGPLVPTRLAVRGIHDERGRGGARQELPLGSRLLLPGAVVTGRVLQADATPVADALVTYANTSSRHAEGRWDCLATAESWISVQRTDAAGRFALRYVPQNPCGGPFRLETRDPVTGAVRGVKTYVRADGQRLSLDLVLVGHGRVKGQVRSSGGAPAAGARVRVVSVTDSQIGVVTTADDQGHYAVENMTVGAVAVTAVSGANLGRAAGRLDAAGGETTVDVTLDGNVDVTGVVQKLEGGVLTPVPGVDVVYLLGSSPLGVSVTDSLGQYRLLGVPAGAYKLQAGLNQRDKTELVGQSVAGQKVVQNLVIEIRDYSSFGTVKGTVRKLDGSPVPDAWVSDNVVTARADSLGRYELAGVALSATPRTVEAVSPDGRRSGRTGVLLTLPGQEVTGADIQLSGLGTAAFQVVAVDGTPVAGATVGLDGSCLHACGCRFATTDDQGIARFANLAFGTVSARAVVTGEPGRWDTATGSTIVASEEVTAGAVLRLEGFGVVTGVVRNPDGGLAHGAEVEVRGRRFVNGPGVCGLVDVPLATVATAADGTFRVEGAHVGPVAARASSVAFPRTVGDRGSISAAGATAHLEMQLLDTMAGALSGVVLEPDGLTGAGPDVEVTAGGLMPDVTVRTDAQGQFSFAKVLPAGTYLLTARDSRPEGTGSVVQGRVYLQPGQDARHDLRLDSKSEVRVTVVDGAGVAVENVRVRVELVESDYPSRRYQATIDGPGSQPAVFPAVFEGGFSVSATDALGRGGRTSGEVPPGGQPVRVTLQLTTTGRVTGRFLWADRATPLPLGTVKLVAGGRVIGQQTTASEGDVGSFAFDAVPAGTVRLEAEDPRSGRTGVATSTLTDEGQVLALDVVAHAVGRVEGPVTLNGQEAPGAEVRLVSGRYDVRVTADGDGLYAVDGVPEGEVRGTADLGGGFLAGTNSGTLSGEGQTLLLPISLRGAATIEGRLLSASGPGPGAVSIVKATVSGRSQTTTSGPDGRFRFDLVPEGSVEVAADALESLDCARTSMTVAGGETVPLDLALRGVGAVEGIARDGSGPVGGQLVVSGTGKGCAPASWRLTLGPGGTFRIPELIAGPVSASFSTKAASGPTLHASASGVVQPGETTILTLVVEPSGRVRGSVYHQDGSPALGAQVRVEAAAGRIAVVPTGDGGAFLAEGIPAGEVTIRVNDAARGGVALVTGLSVPADGTLDAGRIDLLEIPLAVVSIAPEDGTTGVAVKTAARLTFNAPLKSAGGISAKAGGALVAASALLSPDRLAVDLVPGGKGWPDSADVTVEAGLWVTDVYGRRLPAAYQSRFRTLDLSPPRVIATTPPHRAIEVDPGTVVTVLFDEEVATTGDLSPLVRLTGPEGVVAGAVAEAAPDTLVFSPAAALGSNRTYTVTVNGATDRLGHVQTAAFTSTFATLDADGPTLELESPPSVTKERRPTIRVRVRDALAGPDTSRATMRLDGRTVSVTKGADQLSHVSTVTLTDGPHAVEATAHDRAGNAGSLAASFTVDGTAPSAATVSAPSADQVLSGVVAVSGGATDATSGVARLNFLRDGLLVAEAPASSDFAADWDTAGTTDGPHLLTAHAVDAAGNAGPSSPPVRVIVNNAALGVEILAPAESYPVKTTVTVAAQPSEPVARVEFRAGSGPLVVDDTAPYEATLDVSGAPEGLLPLSVTAVGYAPETGTAVRVVLVDRTPPAPPLPDAVHAEAEASSALVVGLPGAVETGARVEVVNPARGARNERASFADASFAMRVAGAAGEALGVVAIDVAGNRSDPLALLVAAADPLDAAVPTDGLALWARPGPNLVVDSARRVRRWVDASPAGNDLVQTSAAPQPIASTDPVSGLEAARFDGKDDFLAFTTRLSASVRTVFAVAGEDEDAGTTASRSLLGDAVTIDFRGGVPHWWYWQPPYASTSASIVNGQTWVNGVAVNGRTTPRPKTPSVLCVEASAGVTASWLGKGGYSSSWKGPVSELLVYERVLTPAERKAVEDTLALRHASYVATAGAPVFTPNGGRFDESVTVALASPTPGARIRYTTDGTEPTFSSPLYAGPFVLSASATVRARAFRPGMKPSTVAAVSFDRASDVSPARVAGLALWVRGDVGLERDAMGRLSAWRDQSGNGNDLVQPTPSLQPVVVPGEANGLPAVRFDGTDDFLAFTSRLAGTVRTVYAVVWEDEDAGASTVRSLLGDAALIDFRGGAPHWWYWLPGYASTSASIINGQTWVNGVVVNGRTTARPKTMSVLCVEATAGVTASWLGKGSYSSPWKGPVVELLVYERALTPAERKAIEDSLALKYAAYRATAGAPELAPNGGTFDGSVEVAVSSPTPGARIRYTTDGSDPTETSAPYSEPFVLAATTTVKARAFHPAMDPSPVVLATFTNRADFSPPGSGLALWVRSDGGLERDAMGRLSAWRDQSGRGNDLVQPTPSLQPVVVPGGANGLPAVAFDGADDFLAFTTRLASTVRTVFAVTWEDEDAGSGTSRSLLGDANTIDFRGGAPHWWYWNPPYASTSASIINGQTWVNGVVVNGRTTARPKTMSVLCVEATAGVTASWLGKGGYSSPWKGPVAELLVYERALTPAERKAVEDSLALKYAAYRATAGAPELAPNGGTFDDSVEVSVSSPTPGARIHYTTDGSDPTETSAPYSEPFVLTATTTVKARAFHPAMDPSPVALATFTNRADFAPPGSGLALWVGGGTGLEADALGRLSAWRDQSGNGNDLLQPTPALQPVVVPGGANGLPAVAFDGTDDFLAFTTPLASTVRTVFAVTWEDEDAGTTTSRSLLGDTSAIDFRGGAPHWWYWLSGYASTSASIINGQTWVNGVVVNGRTTARPKTMSVLCVEATAGVTASWLGKGGYSSPWKGPVAELLVYERALTPAERKAIEDWLAAKYAAYAATVGAPVFTPNGGSFAGSVTVALASPTPGARIHYTTDGSEPTEADARYGEPFVLAATATVRARAFRTEMSPSPVSTATFRVGEPGPEPVPGLALWVRGDAGLETDAMGRLSAWRDQSGNGNDLLQPTPSLQPVVMAAEANGLPAVAFDGTDDFLAFTTRLASTVRTVFAVVWEDEDAGTTTSRSLLGDTSAIDFRGGAPHWWYWNPPYASTSASIVNGQTWINGAPVNGLTTPRARTMSVLCVETTAGVTASWLGKGGYSSPWKGRVAELLVYERALSLPEKKAVEDALALRYAAYAGTVGAPVFAPNGGSFAQSVTVTVASPTPGALVRYTTDGSEPALTSAPYGEPLVLTATTTVQARAFRPGMSPSPVSAVTFVAAADSPAGVTGLALWVRGDAGLEADSAGRLAAWRDQSGRGNHLEQPSASLRPVVFPGEANGLPAIAFDGTDDFLALTTRLSATIRTVFAVVWEDADAGTGSRSLLGDATVYDFRGGTPSWWLSSAPAAAGQTWIDGVPVDGKTTPRPTTLSVMCLEAQSGLTASWLGKGNYSSPWKGRVVELLVYERSLTDTERKRVEDALALKYAAYAGTVGAPVFMPNGGTFSDPVTVTLASPTPGALVHYSLDGSEPTEASPLYDAPLSLFATTTVRARAFRPEMSPSPVQAATFVVGSEPSPGEVPGLLLWVRGDAGLEADAAGRLAAWRDQSGRGNHLEQPAASLRPVVLPGEANGLPAVAFDGTDDFLALTTRLAATIRTVFAVVWEDADAGTGSRSLLGDANVYDFRGGTPYWWLSGSLAATGQTWINGVPVDGKTTPRPKALSVLCLETASGMTASWLGKGNYSNPWKGRVAELVLYDRNLTPGQRKRVEDALALRYAGYVATTGAPEFTPDGATFSGAVEVSLWSPTPGADIRYTTDGSEPTEASALYEGPLVLTESTMVQARAYRAGMIPGPASFAHFVRTGDLSPAAVPGLALWARADVGVATDEAGGLTRWLDVSGRGNDLAPASASARPALVPDAQASLPAVHFDGVDDALLFKSRLTGIRTVFWVVREEASATNGYRFLLGDASAYHFHSGAARQIFSTSASAAVTGGETRVNGVRVDGKTTNRPTALSVVSLRTTDVVTADAFSRDRTYGRSWWGDLAELIVYDRELSDADRKAVEDYLALKYALYVPTADAPVFTPNGSTALVPVRVSLAVAPGAVARYTLDGSDPTASSPVYEGPFDLASPTTVRTRAFRPGFYPSPVASARFLASGTPAPLLASGLKLWVAADADVTVTSGLVSSWADQSGNGNHLVQAAAASQPQLVEGALNGRPAVRFDGAGDFMAFTSRLTTIRTVFWVVRADPASLSGYRYLLGDATVYHFCSGSSSRIWDTSYTSASIRSGETRLNGVAVSGLTTDRPTIPSVISVVTTGDVSADAFSRDRTYGRSWWGDLAELIVYDRPLSDPEVESIEGYLAEKYGLWVPTVVAPSITLMPGAAPGTTVVQLDSGTAGAEIRYTLDDTEPTEAAPLYAGPFEVVGAARVRARAFLPGWNPSGETVASVLDPSDFSPASLADLALWVRADAVLAPGRPAEWLDQSGSGNHLVQPGVLQQPSLVLHEATRMPLLRFDGTDDTLFFTRRLTGIRTVFWVVMRSPAMTPGYRQLLGDVSTYDFLADSTTKLFSSSASAFVRDGQARIDGGVVPTLAAERPTALSVVSLVTTGDVRADAFSRDRTYGRSWWGDLAELVIYERALSAAEVRAVEEYLAGRYGIGLAP